MSQTKKQTVKDEKKTAKEEQLENFRLQVVEDELYARLNKAAYERMYYHIEAYKLSEEYSKVLEESRVKREKQQEELQKTLDQFQASQAIQGQA